MNYRIPFLVITSLLLSTPNMPSQSATPIKPGAICTKEGLSKTYQGRKYICIKSGKKLIWNKGVVVPKAQPSPSASPTVLSSPSPTPSPSPILTPSPTPSATPSPSPTSTKQVLPLTDLNKFQPMSTCQISSTITGNERQHLGFPRSNDAIPFIGEFRAITLFVYFDDLPAEKKQIDEWKNNQIPTFERLTEAMSYGRLKYKVDTFDQFLHIKKSVLTYNLDTPHDDPMKPNADVEGLIRDAVAVADPLVDFSKYQFVNVVTAATTKIGFEGVFMKRGLIVADGVTINNSTFGPIREYVDDPTKKIWLLHEVGHLWGLIHTFETGDVWRRVGFPKFSAMANGTSSAPEYLAWEKFVLNWFGESQVACLSNATEAEYTIKLNDLSTSSPGIKMVTVKLSSNETLVMESRKAGRDSQILPDEEGVFAYYVNADIRTNLGTAKVIYKDNPPASGWYPSTLAKGDKATFRNYIIEILDSDPSGEIVKLSIKK